MFQCYQIVLSSAIILIVFWVGQATYAAEENEYEHQLVLPGAELPSGHEPVALDEKLEVDRELSEIDTDERLKFRLENALNTYSEEELVKFVDMDIGDYYKRRVLMTLADIYEKQESPSRLIGVYEKFIESFTNDKDLPTIYLKLGIMYREIGASKLALAKFYNVLNVALNVPVYEIKDYQQVSHRAQLEIAETFFEMGAYDQATRFYNRLLRLDLQDSDYERVMFKNAYTTYLNENYPEAIVSLRSFLNRYPSSELSPESRYLLSDSYSRLNDPKAAMKETLQLLESESKNASANPAVWQYWQQRTGNQLANQFYNESNFMDALIIYQAMHNLSEDPHWKWPILYQIGLCFEKLGMKPKAIEAYQSLNSATESLPEDIELDATLSSIKEMAVWRLERLELDLDMEFDLQKILQN